MRKNIQHIKLQPSVACNTQEDTAVFSTAEGITTKQTYTEADNENLEHLDFGAGFAPNLRGSYATMYVRQPWEIRQSVALGSAAQYGYDSHSEHTSIDSVEDIKARFEQTPLDEISVSIFLNDNVLPIIAFYIIAAEEQGIKPELLSGTIQKDTLREAIVNSTNTYHAAQSIKIIADILEYTGKYMPGFNCISISGYHVQEAGATADIELAYTLADGLEYIRTGLAAGMKIDDLATHLSFSWGIGMNHFMEIAKMRAGRMLWAKLLKQLNPKDEKSLALRAHCQISGRSLTEQDPFNNVARTTTEAAAAAFGGTQSLHTNVHDKTVAVPADFSARLAQNTQIFLQEETKITKTVDPWGGSYYVESLTDEIARKAWALIEEIEALGGMAKAIEAGIPKLRIEEVAARKQARIDSKEDIIVGVNKYRFKKETLPQTPNTDYETAQNQRIKKLENIMATRDNAKVVQSLEALTHAAQNGTDNLLTLTIEAARHRATLGEITDAMKKLNG